MRQPINHRTRQAGGAILALALALGRVFAAETNAVAPTAGGAPADKSKYNLFNPTPENLLRDINALYENPWTVDAGHLQVETFVFQYFRDHETANGADLLRETYRFGPMSIKLGLLNDLDAQLVMTPYSHVQSTDGVAKTSLTQEGFGDLATRLKLNLWGNDGGPTAGAVIPFVRWPTSQDHLGANAVGGGVVVPLSFQLPRGWWLVLSPELDCYHNLNSDGYHLEAANTFYFCHQIAGKFSGYADFFATISAEKGVPWTGIMDFGLTYAWTRNLQVDLGLSVGVTDKADDLNPYLGFSFRL